MSECTIRGCRNLEWKCADCGRVASTATIANVPGYGKWISIENQLPELENWVLGVDKFHEIRVCQREKRWRSEEGEWYYSHQHIFFPTHWMPLPDLPK